ncbi:MAG: GGDEF domain-containing protein, partial [Bdellovibrionales bacterium]|nr:GGDEF domain-containing protein [Bdellovibrionales bacterium]
MQLKEAVEANSINDLKNQSREFIDSYIEFQSKKENRNKKKMAFIENNLSTVRKKLVDANNSMRRDHLTGAFNRKSFDEQIKQLHNVCHLKNKPASLMILDIDFFKKINDNYGHDIGDFILVECVKLLNKIFSREVDFVARIGGEEFAILLPDYRIEHAAEKAFKALEIIRKEVFIQDGHELRFTVSMGIAQLGPDEDTQAWIKRADQALYESKNSGRNKFTLSKYMKSHMKSVS